MTTLFTKINNIPQNEDKKHSRLGKSVLSLSICFSEYIFNDMTTYFSSKYRKSILAVRMKTNIAQGDVNIFSHFTFDVKILTLCFDIPAIFFGNDAFNRLNFIELVISMSI